MRFRPLVICMMLVGALAARGGGEEPPVLAVPREAKPWCYWWWMGSAVDPENIRHELQRYHDAGLGGVHVIPIYGAKGYEQQYIDYLSPKWMGMLKVTVEEAGKLDMGVDMTLGTGWCFGGPQVKPEEACLRPAVKVTDVAAGGTFRAKVDPGQVRAVMAYGGEGPSMDLTSMVKGDGSIEWQSATAARVYVLTASGQRGIKVKRAAPGGQGYMVNPFYGAAVEDFLAPFTRAFEAYRGPKPRAVYHDSYEYNSAWSPDLLDEFQRRRGYRLQDHLPQLFGEGKDDFTARVKHDYRETLSDLMVDHFNPTWMNWARERGFIVRDEAHGSPGNWLDLYAQADVPETEMFHKDRDVLVAKFASSTAHVAGRRLASAETGTWMAEHFTETLGEMKGLVDEMFLAGVNHVFYHGTCYSPDEAAWPGWCFYASTEMNPRNPIWHDVGALNAYVARCQEALQEGKSDNDLLVYWPVHDYWMKPEGLVEGLTVGNAKEWFRGQPIGKAAQGLWEKGYAFDYASDRQIAGAKVKDGRVEVAGGAYRAIVVPPTKYMPLGTAKALAGLAREGATVIFEGDVPRDVPGVDAGGAGAAAMADVWREVKGRVIVGDRNEALAAAKVPREAMVDMGIQFVRRRTAEGPVYWLVNRGQRRVSAWVRLAAIGEGQLQVSLLDPMTNEFGGAALKRDGNETLVFVQLDVGQSIVVASVNTPAPGGWTYVSEPDRGEAKDVGGEWQVTFVEGGPEMPPPLATERLESWTKLGGEAGERFGGTAVYTTTFDAPVGADGKAAGKCWLDLGVVAQSARVRVNDEECGTVIAPPYRVLVEHLKPTENALRVEVTNVGANRIRDMDRRGVAWKTFGDINVVNVEYKPFDASTWPVTESGLMGPVVVRGADVVAPR